MSNVEGMYSARRELLCRTVYFIKRLSKAKPPFDILRFAFPVVLRSIDLVFSAIRYSATRSLIRGLKAKGREDNFIYLTPYTLYLKPF